LAITNYVRITNYLGTTSHVSLNISALTVLALSVGVKNNQD